MPKDKETELSAEERKARFLRLAGIWSETEEGEEYYQMMKHRNDGHPLNREINLDDQRGQTSGQSVSVPVTALKAERIIFAKSLED